MSDFEYTVTLRMRREDEERLERLAEKLDISGKEVIWKALEWYEELVEVNDKIKKYWACERMVLIGIAYSRIMSRRRNVLLD